jgi:signal peptidase II
VSQSLALIRSYGWLVAGVIIGLDQASKALMKTFVVPNWSDKVFVTPFFNLVHYWNHGVSFGLFSELGQGNAKLIVLAITGLITGIVVWWLLHATRTRLAFSYGLVVGGAASNILDRLFTQQQAVFDFLQLHAGNYYWPAFNLADSAIVLGVIVLLYDTVRSPPQLKGSADHDDHLQEDEVGK